MKKDFSNRWTWIHGSHTVVELQNEGFDVVIIDDLSNSSLQVLENITAITTTNQNLYSWI